MQRQGGLFVKKYLSALLLTLLLCSAAHAQQYVWANAYGLQENTEAGTFIREVHDGQYYLMLGFIRTPATDNESAETDCILPGSPS